MGLVERYFGREAAEKTAFVMEYQGTGWKDRNSNASYVTYMAAQERKAEQGRAHIDPVCGMVVEDKDAPSSVYKGTTYYFCARADKDEFDTNPQQYAK